LKDGTGQHKLHNGDSYDGDFREGKPEGRGRYDWACGASYIGEFKEGLRSGQGKWKSGSIGGKGHSYEG
jgi:hypothetical protein